jgi:transposase
LGKEVPSARIAEHEHARGCANALEYHGFYPKSHDQGWMASNWSWSCPDLTDTILLLNKESKKPRNHNPKPPYPAQFRQQMIDIVATGRRPSELAREFGCHETSILSWRVAKGEEAAPAASSQNSAALNAAERQELIELRRKLRQVQMECDILAKAKAWFAGKSEATPTASTR